MHRADRVQLGVTRSVSVALEVWLVDGEGDTDLVSVQLTDQCSAGDTVTVFDWVRALVVLHVTLAVGDPVPVVETCPDVV